MDNKKGTLALLASWGEVGYSFDVIGPETRVYFADGEDLAEGGIASWLEALRPHLESQGVILDEDEVDDIEFTENYRMSINGRAVTIYENAGRDCWYFASMSAIRIVNWLLETANSPERCYLLSAGGNEAISVFISQDMYQRLITSPDLNLRDKPDDFGSLDSPTDNKTT